jgi:WD40 repeat protein
LQIWNYSEGKNDEPLVISDHPAWVLGTSFSADGNSVFSVGEDRTLRQWLVNEALMLKVLDVKRDMTKEEWLKYAGQHLNMSNR